MACPFRSFSLLSALEVFEKFSTKIHGDKYFFWSDFLAKMGQILVRFSGNIGQIVSQILENFSQILIIFTPHMSDSKPNGVTALALTSYTT